MASLAHRWESRLFYALFVAALATHAVFVFSHLWTPFLVGHEFRQTQTALITYYIDQQNNFSPIYEQPILGKPWVGLILEFPLYQWAVVGLSRVMEWPHFVAARVISIASFYAALPALALLLGRFGLTWPRRWFVLTLTLLCPVYIFYTRAFLMDAMEFMFCAWFTAAFVRTMDGRDWRWWLVALAAGVPAALVKGFMLAIWLMPAAAYGAWSLWRDVRAQAGWRATLATAAWGLSTVVAPLGALKWWVALTDPIKAAHASAEIFTSANLSLGNWGLGQFSAMFSGEVWALLLARWDEAIMPWWLIVIVAVAGVVALPKVRGKALGLLAVFFLSQLLFPFAYTYQDYYYYSCAVFLMTGFGLMVLAVWDRVGSKWIAVSVMAGLMAAQVITYWTIYRPMQTTHAEGWTSFTRALKDLTPEGSVVVIAGRDWAAIMPYYAQRRALMIRNGLEHERDYLERAFNDLADEDVAALVVADKVRQNSAFLEYALEKLGMERVPVFTQMESGDVYMPRRYAVGAHTRLRNNPLLYGKETTVPERPPVAERRPIELTPAQGRVGLPWITPAPFKVDLEFGLLPGDYAGVSGMSAHANTRVWLRPPAGAREIVWEFGFDDAAWAKDGDKTNGVEFIVTGEMPDGSVREVWKRLLIPRSREEDRGLQRAVIAYTPRDGEVLRFAALDNGSIAFDWAFWRRIEVK